MCRSFELIFNIIYKINNISLKFRFVMHKENSSIYIEKSSSKEISLQFLEEIEQ